MVDPALQALVEEPLGSPELQAKCQPDFAPPEAVAMAKRCTKIFLPAGKKAVSGPVVREQREAFYAKQVDLEDAVEAAGGNRGGGPCRS